MHNFKKTACVFCFLVFHSLLCSCLFAQDKSEGNILQINSYPQGAKVYINNKYSGTTPLQIFNSDKNDLRIKAELNGVSREQIIGFVKGIYELYFVLDGDYGILNIKSNPDSASVYINDVPAGTTPLREWRLHLGSYKLSIKKKDYGTVENVIFVRSTKYDYNVNLKLNFSIITPEDKSIKTLAIDGLACNSDSSSSFRVPSGRHDIELKPDGFFRSIGENFEIEGGSLYSLNSSYGYYTPKYLFLSAVLPGLGQFSDRSYVQGVGYFLGTFISTAFYVKAALDYDDFKVQFNRNRESYFGAKNEPDAIKYRALLESSLSDMNKSAKRKNLFLGAALGIYFLNIADAVIFHSLGSDLRLSKIAEINAGTNSLGVKIKLN